MRKEVPHISIRILQVTHKEIIPHYHNADKGWEGGGLGIFWEDRFINYIKNHKRPKLKIPGV